MVGQSDAIPDQRRMTDETAERLRVVVCVNKMRGPRGKCCGLSGSPEIGAALESGVQTRQLNVDVETIVCFGKCGDGPNLRIVGAEFRQHLTLEDVPSLLDEFESRAGRIENGALLYPGA